MRQLYQWQQEAYEAWKANDGKGTIKSTTGAGKTQVALEAIHEVRGKTLIVVPTEHLQHQWKKELLGGGVVREEQIGLVGGGGSEFTKDITIAIVNSLRDKVLVRDLLVLDETHRHLSPENISFLKRGLFKYIIALSATPERLDLAHEELFKVAPIVYDYDSRQARDEGIICRYDVVNVGVELTEFEKGKYDTIQNFIDENFPNFNKDFETVRKAIGPSYRGGEAAKLMKCFTWRRNLLLNAANKITAALEIVCMESAIEWKKMIIFTEYIKTAEELKKRLGEMKIDCGIYHSKMKLKERAKMLEEFKEGKFKIMITVKCLDEGINVPDAEVGIIVSGSKVERQAIQRLGRILRQRENKKAKLYQIYVKDTKDQDWTVDRCSVFKGVADNISWRHT